MELKEHSESNLPPYAILFHRWGPEEITFVDLRSGLDLGSKEGGAKLRGFCDVARRDNYEWAWSDTCCINKDSATELGAALNTMYRWYEEAGICIVCLADVGPELRSMEEPVWFERGWTLQELIAPSKMILYNHSWDHIGTKNELLLLLQEATKIPPKILNHTAKPRSYSIAQRMSWAANRKTERINDRAYSLMGLFDVQMGMIYGERENAFIRLQEHIMKDSADQSIFLWDLDNVHHQEGYAGLLAPSPSSFANYWEVCKTGEPIKWELSNLGLSIKLPTRPYDMQTYSVYLECTQNLQPRPQVCHILAEGTRQGPICSSA